LAIDDQGGLGGMSGSGHDDRGAIQASEDCFDILRGIARLTGRSLVEDVARCLETAPLAALAVAFNRKQIASKLFLCDHLFETFGGDYDQILVVGGWYGVLAALLFDDPRFAPARITSLDIDPTCAAVAQRLNRRFLAAGRFAALTGDMNRFDYRSFAGPRDLVINTSCEHLADVRGWLGLLPPLTRIALQSNDYRREPDHRSCVDSLEAFEQQACLSDVLYRGTLPTKNYRRFMLIGRR
jgi:hypothetical protein